MRSKDSNLMKGIADFIENEYMTKGIIPTMREMATKFNVTPACISNYIQEMKQNGLIECNGKARSFKTKNMCKFANQVSYIPLVGKVSCGLPILAEQNIEEYIPIATEFLGSGKYFILKANGSSMLNAGICDGDLVIIKQQEIAEEGQIVVALIDDEATLKRYFIDKNNKKICLHPENEDFKDMFFDNILIQGIAIKVIKDVI